MILLKGHNAWWPVTPEKLDEWWWLLIFQNPIFFQKGGSAIKRVVGQKWRQHWDHTLHFHRYCDYAFIFSERDRLICFLHFFHHQKLFHNSTLLISSISLFERLQTFSLFGGFLPSLHHLERYSAILDALSVSYQLLCSVI